MNLISIYIPSLNGGGAERVMLTMANALADSNYATRVDLLVNKIEGPYIKDVSKSINLVSLNSKRTAFSLIPLAKYLNKQQPNVIISAMNYVNIITVIAKMLSHSKTHVIVTEHTDLMAAMRDNKNALRNFILKTLMQYTYKKADAIVAVSKGAAKALAQQTKIDISKITTIYNPVVTDKLIHEQHELINHPWMKKETPYIIGVGRLIPLKNFEALITAYSYVQRYIDINLVILGQGHLKEELQKLVRDLRIEEKVLFTGFVDNPYPWIKNAECFVLSSRYEGLPTVLIEAMACGTPIVSTDCPSGPSEILENGLWGELVPISDIEALSKAILKVLSKDYVKKDVMERASFFSVDNALKGYLTILDSFKS